MADDLAWMDATAQAALVRSGSVSPAELVDAAIARIEKVDPELNAVIHRRFDRARQEAADSALPDGPFRGVPFLVKDLFAPTAGDPMNNGMRSLRDAGYVASADNVLTGRYRRAGFIFVGRTNTPELGLVPTTEPVAHGATSNPWSVTHTPRGSSGGSAAAAALLESHGHHVEEDHPAILDAAEISAQFGARWCVNARLGVVAAGDLVGRALTADDVEPATWMMASVGETVSGVDFALALAGGARLA